MKKAPMQTAILSAALLAGFALSAKPFSEIFPLGVYHGWERNPYNAKVEGLSTEAYVDRLLQLCQDRHCDTIWIVNGPRPTIRPARTEFLDLCEKHGMKALLNSDLQDYFHRAFDGNWDELDARIAKSIADLSSSDAFLGYVLKDEPRVHTVEQIDAFANALKRADLQHRDSLVVASPWSFQPFTETSSFGTVCTDIYYFGGDHAGGRPFTADGDIPAPADQSLWWFRRSARNAWKSAHRSGKNPWIMVCAFGGGDGNIFLENGKRYLAAGGYHLYRMPTPAEIKWQAWESVRLGYKGLFYYVLTSESGWQSRAEMNDPKNAAWVKRNAERAKRSVGNRPGRMEEKDLEIDLALGLMYPGLRPSPQFDAVGDVYGKLAGHRDRLLAAKPSDFPAFSADVKEPCRTATFMWIDTTDRLGVIVNDDFYKEHEFTVSVPARTVRVWDLNGGELALGKGRDGLKTVKVRLGPGEGALLRAKFEKGQAGMGLCREDFDKINRRGQVGESGVQQPGGTEYGIFAETNLKLREGADPTKPVWHQTRLALKDGAWNVCLMSLNVKSRQAWTRVTFDGDFLEGMRLEATVFENGAETKKTFWKYGDPLPATLPVGTLELQVYLTSTKSEVRDLVIWAEPL